MKIRAYAPADESAVIALWTACGLTRPWNDPRRDIARKLGEQPELFLVGEADGGIVATAMFGFDGTRGWVHYLGVAPFAQRRGYARRLMDAGERLLVERGCPKLNLQVRASNVEVLAFYERLGYRVDDVVGMGKRLIADEAAPISDETVPTLHSDRTPRPFPDPEATMRHPTLDRWHDLVGRRDAAGLDALLADDVVFHSPVVHSPQRGRALAHRYLAAAFGVFFDDSFRYVREIVGPCDAVLEFQVTIDGIEVNGVDLIRWGDDGRIVDFKVMIRPLKAIDLIHRKMAAMLQASQPDADGAAQPAGPPRG